MADNYNHSHLTIEQEIIHTVKHPKAENSTKYFTREKYLSDYSLIFKNEMQ